jgi:hypothetical protein
MSTPSRPSTFSIAARVIPWMLNLATRLLARVLNMPEPLVHNTGVFVFVHVQAVETSIGNRLLRQLQSLAPTGVPVHHPSTLTSRRPVMIHASVLLRRAFLLDTVASGMMALLLTFGAGELAPLLNLPEPLLRETGLVLIAYTALVGWLATRQSMPKRLVMIVIAINAAWTVASIALLFSNAVTPNLLGQIFIAGQAIVPGALAELQYIGLRRSSDAVTI